MPHLPKHLQLTGGDYFIYALDRQMRRAGLEGNVCRMELRLEGPLDAGRLRAALAASPMANWFARVRMIRLLPILSPVWRAHRDGTGLVIAEHDGAAGEPGRRLRSNRAPAIALDLHREQDGSSRLVLAWHHALMDERGAELLLRHIACGTGGPGVTPASFLHDPAQADFGPMRVLRGYVRKVIFARQSLHFIGRMCREPLFSLMPPRREEARTPSPKPPVSDSRVIWFDAGETARIDAHCESLNAAFRRSHFYLACCFHAFHRLANSRGNREGAYLVPVPHDLRQRGASGPVFSNQVSFLFYRLDPTQTVRLGDIIPELTRQTMDQIRGRTPESFMAAMELFKPTPLGFYIRQLGSSSRGKFASFCFSDAGESFAGMDDFFGARVTAVTHYAPAARPPGLTIVFSRTRGRLCAVISRVGDCVGDGELDALERDLRAALLGPEALD